MLPGLAISNYYPRKGLWKFIPVRSNFLQVIVSAEVVYKTHVKASVEKLRGLEGGFGDTLGGCGRR